MDLNVRLVLSHTTFKGFKHFLSSASALYIFRENGTLFLDMSSQMAAFVPRLYQRYNRESGKQKTIIH